MSSWSSFTALAKSALYNAQKKIDLVLDIQDESDSDSKPYDVVELAKSGDDESSNWIASRMGIDAKSRTMAAWPVLSSSGSPPCSTDSGDEASAFAGVEYDVHSCVNFLISEVCSRVEPTTMTKEDDYCSDPLGNAGSAFSSYVYIPGGCSTSTASSRYRKKESASKGNGGGSVCTSPTEEADTATTSSDIEVIGTSIEDYCSDNGNGNEARLACLSDLNGKQGSYALFRLSLQKRHPNELKCKKRLSYLILILFSIIEKCLAQNDAHLNEMLHIYEKVSAEIGVQLKRKIAELTDKLAAEDSTNSALSDVNSRLIKENEKLKSLLQHARENENRIEQLLEEGERLSKKELQQSNIIKLLRQKEKESNNTITRMSVAVNELESVKKVLKKKENLTEEQQEQITNLQKKLQQQDVVVGKLQSKIEEYEATCNLFEAKMKAMSIKRKVCFQILTSEKCFRDLADVTALKVASEFEVQKLKELTVQNKEMELREKLQLQERHFSQEKAALLKQVDHLTAQSKEIRDESLRRESALKWENSQLQQKLQDFETFKQDMSESVAVASKPLFDQIYDLQATIATQRNQWESVERALNEKIKHGEKKVGEALGKVGELEMAISATKSQLKRVERELQATFEERDLLRTDLQIAKQQLSTFSQNQEKFDEMLMREKRHSLPIEAIDVEKMFNEKCEHLEVEYRKTVQQLEDQLAESKLKKENLEFELGELKRSSAVCTSQREEEYSIIPVQQNENFTTNENRASFSMSEQVSFSEKLCDKLQLKENELALVKNELRQLQVGRERLAAEVIRLTNSCNELQAKLNANNELNVVHQDLNEKHQALLQMYGEKVEENESLLQELQEVKRMFRLQLEKLLNSNDNSSAISGDASPSLP
ncbi:TATA element modulatory factor [Trichinella patagoniensis]|uniref:TATA element modulatory factor n=1 Tax=Trichinella patagoniensis TaxID=990121 RepID=A0A0V0ZSB2_9BILA|nr:TATA element modulatory factor [Trichinella patagoniensis]